MAMFIDVHAHLDHPMFSDDIDRVIENARNAGVKVIIAQGLDPVSNRAVLEFAKRYDVVKPALGIYPPDALKKEMEMDSNPRPLPEFDIDEELEFIRKSAPLAFGEVGLEYKNGTDIPAQKVLFQKFIELSEKTATPLIIHSRKAELDVVDMLESSNAKRPILHCFCGRKHLVKRAADNGWSFSVSTNVVKSEQFQDLVRSVHISQLLTETDCPYLSPFVGKRNEPAFVVESTKKIAELKGMTVEDTANNIFMNYQNMFLK
ncbi:TatD family hydrolase [Candidatus Woesearchaeota archaeon]|nr:TatD family hydrolase [Candidatus Woesearchaeota archaeon]